MYQRTFYQNSNGPLSNNNGSDFYQVSTDFVYVFLHSSLLSSPVFFSSPSFLHFLVPHPSFVLPLLFFLPFCQIQKVLSKKKKKKREEEDLHFFEVFTVWSTHTTTSAVYDVNMQGARSWVRGSAFGLCSLTCMTVERPSSSGSRESAFQNAACCAAFRLGQPER